MQAGLARFGAMLCVLAPSLACAQDRPVLTGEAALGDWRDDAPGVRRLIRPGDLPPPFATDSVGNGGPIVRLPRGAGPIAPEGFVVDLFAEALNEPRTIRVAPNGDVFVAESGAGRVDVFRTGGAARPVAGAVFARGLGYPYGIAFHPPGPDPQWVYVANTGSVFRFPYRNGDMEARGRPEVVVADLPVGGHWTRDIAFSPDGSRLYVSVGSASNAGEAMASATAAEIAAVEAADGVGAAWGRERGRATVLTFDPEGNDRAVFATGVRNCSGIAVQPGTGDIWCATNERDGLGDNLPPDYVTRIREGGFYGWPWFYSGDNPDPRSDNARPDLAGKVTVPDVLVQAHSAPLAIAFHPGDGFPGAYDGDAFVTLHGSWNRSLRTGYKVVRILTEGGVPTGAYEDFLTGFVLSADAVWGRPTGIAVDADGALLVSEDGNGTIWRVTAAE
jgi:glucose/arabinose dehydrogenase